MEVETWVKQKKELYTPILSFLESESESEDEFRALTKIIYDQEIIKNEQSLKEIFQLLYEIGDNHHWTEAFFNRLVRILKYLKKDRLPISITETLDIHKINKRLLLLLFEHKIIIPDESIVKYLTEQDNSNDQQLKYYLFSEIKNYLCEETKKSIENQITKEFNVSIEAFISKIKEGANDSIICNLIRQDLIEEFISYVSRTNLSLTSTIKADFYESNSFLIENEPSLIEYAFFYGSIQVIKYLRNNHVEFPSQICQYAIHSNNPEMIEYLEENGIKFDKESVIESIKCHHNAITDYILEKLIDQTQDDKFYNDINRKVIEYCNYYYLPEDIISMISNPSKSKFKMCYLTTLFSKITIPYSVTLIKNDAFSGCSSLTQISIPSSVTSIGESAFENCSSLTQITIPSSVTSIGDYAFYYCSSLTQITIPSSVTSIGNNSFSGCSSLEQITIPSSVTSIGKYAFYRCSSLTQITIPSSVTSIEESTFAECTSLTQITIPSSVTSIGKYAFYRCSSLTQITIPSSVTSIEESTFAECTSLTQITIPSSVTLIGDCAFYRCESLAQITIPSSLIMIRMNAFGGCKSLTQILTPSILDRRYIGIDSSVMIINT